MRLVVLVLATLAFAPARAENLVSVSDAGLYDITGVQHLQDAGATNGRHVVADGRLVERATRACLKLGTVIGVRFTLSQVIGVDALPVTFGIEHPAMTNYAGKTQSADTFPGVLTAGAPHLAFWVFETPAELKPGRWHFTVSHGGVTLADQPFDVDVTCQKLVS